MAAFEKGTRLRRRPRRTMITSSAEAILGYSVARASTIEGISDNPQVRRPVFESRSLRVPVATLPTLLVFYEGDCRACPTEHDPHQSWEAGPPTDLVST